MNPARHQALLLILEKAKKQRSDMLRNFDSDKSDSEPDLTDLMKNKPDPKIDEKYLNEPDEPDADDMDDMKAKRNRR